MNPRALVPASLRLLLALVLVDGVLAATAGALLGELVQEVAGQLFALLVACAVATAFGGVGPRGVRAGPVVAGVLAATAAMLLVADAGPRAPPGGRAWDQGASVLRAALRGGVGLAIAWSAALATAAALPLPLVRRAGAGPAGQVAAGAAAGLVAAGPAMPGPAAMSLGLVIGAAMGLVASQLVPVGEEAAEPPVRGSLRAWLPVALGAVVAALALGVAHRALVPALLRASLPAGAPEPRSIASLLLGAAEAQRRHLDRTGLYARDLASLSGVDSAVLATAGHGYIFRHAWIGRGKAWALAADPVPPLPGLPYLVVRLPGATKEPRVDTEAGPARLGP